MNHSSGAVAGQFSIILGSVLVTGPHMCNTKLGDETDWPKNKVMNTLADFIRWNHKVMDSRVMPTTGFYNEKFGRTSYRCKQRGKPIMGTRVGIFAGMKCEGKARVTMTCQD